MIYLLGVTYWGGCRGEKGQGKHPHPVGHLGCLPEATNHPVGFRQLSALNNPKQKREGEFGKACDARGHNGNGVLRGCVSKLSAGVCSGLCATPSALLTAPLPRGKTRLVQATGHSSLIDIGQDWMYAGNKQDSTWSVRAPTVAQLLYVHHKLRLEP